MRPSSAELPALSGRSSFFEVGPPAAIGEAHRPIVQFVSQQRRGTSLLDLGGGQGAYAYELQKEGAVVTVADINPRSLSVAQESGLPTLLLQEEAPLPDDRYDTVMMIEVLEHLDQPLELLQRAAAIARQRVILTCPCSDQFETLFGVGLTYSHIAVVDHLMHYTEPELRALLEQIAPPEKITITKGDALAPWAALQLLHLSIRNPVLRWLTLFPLRVLNKLKLLSPAIPSRYYCVIDLL